MLNPDGTPVLDPATGEAMTGTNVYARYFTQDVQRITLPAGVLTDNLAGNSMRCSRSITAATKCSNSRSARPRPRWPERTGAVAHRRERLR